MQVDGIQGDSEQVDNHPMDKHQAGARHTGMGIASFVTSMVAAVLVFMLLLVAGVMEVTTPGGIDEESAGAVIVGLCIIALLGIDLVAIGLGIAALLQVGSKKVFAVLGLVFACVTIVGTLLLMVIGNTM